ncbi:MAG: hypothetical protein HUU19_07810 [Phycisphaerales bacterium]|nr:hypothetical protein [Phycisphaerales bacterium]
MKRTLAIAVLVSLAGCSMPARNAEPPDQAKKPEPPTLAGGMMVPDFPADWVGHWKGSGATMSGGNFTYHFTLELDIQPIARPDGTMPPSPGSVHHSAKPGDRYTWKMTYTDRADKSKPADVREYQVVVRDPAMGEFVIDEGAGVELVANELMGSVHSAFSVGEQQLVASYVFNPDTKYDVIEMRIATFKPGDQKPVGDAAQGIRSGPVQSLQACGLVRWKPAKENQAKGK